MKCFLKFSFLFQTCEFTGELELAVFSLLLLCPHRKPEVDHRALMLGLDIGPAELGCGAYRQTLRPLVVSTSGYQQGPYLSGLQRTCLCSIDMEQRHALIPAYAFGEVDLYHQHIFTSGGLVNHFQKWFQSVHSFTLVLSMNVASLRTPGAFCPMPSL